MYSILVGIILKYGCWFHLTCKHSTRWRHIATLWQWVPVFSVGTGMKHLNTPERRQRTVHSRTIWRESCSQQRSVHLSVLCQRVPWLGSHCSLQRAVQKIRLVLKRHISVIDYHTDKSLSEIIIIIKRNLYNCVWVRSEWFLDLVTSSAGSKSSLFHFCHNIVCRGTKRIACKFHLTNPVSSRRWIHEWIPVESSNSEENFFREGRCRLTKLRWHTQRGNPRTNTPEQHQREYELWGGWSHLEFWTLRQTKVWVVSSW